MQVTLEALRRQRRRLKRAWSRYIHAQRVPDLAQDVTRSWERSSQHLTPLQTRVPVEDREGAALEWQNSPLYSAALPLLDDIKHAADESGYLVAICDSTGKILWTYSSEHMERYAERLNFVPGGLVDESSAGTNALALALRTLKPTRVFSAEHYTKAFHDWVCYSAPIRGAEGQPVGVIDLSSTWDNTNAMGLVTVTALARCLEERLLRLGRFEDHATEPMTTPISTERRPWQRASPASDSDAPLYLKLCGTPQVTLHGGRLKLTPRQLEILALLALHAEGLSLDTLYTHLYTDEAVSFSTLKAEVSVLRGFLGGEIGSRPYRLILPFTADVLQLKARLSAGDMSAALQVYSGSLLPQSDSPRLSEWRSYLD